MRRKILIHHQKTKTVRRGSSSTKDSAPPSSPSGVNRKYFIPRWPKGLYDVCTPYLWKQLSQWKSYVNKENLTSEEKRKLLNYTIMPPEKTSHKRDFSKDNNKSYSNSPRKDSGKRSSKSNRHTDDSRRSRRGKRDRSSSEEHSFKDEDSSVASSQSDHHRSTKTSRRGRSSDRAKDRDRSASAVMGGILRNRI